MAATPGFIAFEYLKRLNKKGPKIGITCGVTMSGQDYTLITDLVKSRQIVHE